MDPLIGGILIDVAGKVGAPIVKGLLEKYVGGVGSEIGGAVVDTIAGKLGVPVEDIATKPTADIEAAVAATEQAAPQLLLDFATRQHELSNELQLAEMQKVGEPTWTWAWRPGGMWLLLGLIPFYAIVVPLIDLLLALFGSQQRLSAMLVLTVGAFVQLFTYYCALYMGGHTAKDLFAKAKDALVGGK